MSDKLLYSMAEETFSDLGRVEAIAKLYEGTPYKPFEEASFETSGKSVIQTKARTFIEGIDFDLTYFPLKHLGYKCVTAVTGELYASFSHPRTLEIRLGISAKLDFKHIKEVWEGAVTAAKEHGYINVGLDLLPSPNGLLQLAKQLFFRANAALQPRAWISSVFPITSVQHLWDSRYLKEKERHSKRAEM